MKWFVIQFMLLMTMCASAQTDSGAFNAMLHVLLSHSVPEISVKQAVERQDLALFLDARELREYEVSHIKGSKHIGYKTFNLSSLHTIPKEHEIVIYCSVGYRSEKVAEKLQNAGFTRISNLYGGIFEWKNQGHDVYNASGSTDNIHAYDRMWGIWLTRGTKVYK